MAWPWGFNWSRRLSGFYPTRGRFQKVHKTRIRRVNCENLESQNTISAKQTDIKHATELRGPESDLSTLDEESTNVPRDKKLLNDRTQEVHYEKAINPGPGKFISFKPSEPGFEGKTIEAKIENREGKATGKHKDWWNVIYSAPEELAGNKDCIDFSKLEEASITNVLIENSDEFAEAKQDEMDNWLKNGVFIEVNNEGQRFMTCRWVLTVKPDRKKATLVRCFEDPDIDSLIKDSPTCSRYISHCCHHLCSKKLAMPLNGYTNSLSTRRSTQTRRIFTASN